MHTSAAAAADIDVWYGLWQKVGNRGEGVRDFDLLGHVPTDRVASLSYSLNGGTPQAVFIHKETARLEAPGDFDVWIPMTQLHPGLNTVLLTASHHDRSISHTTVTIDRQRGSAPLPTVIDWSTVVDPQDVGQCLDGNWTIADGALRVAAEYDRIFAIGDHTWQDYEIVAPITIENLPGHDAQGGVAAVGFALRFLGYQDPRKVEYFWLPRGAVCWLCWKPSIASGAKLQFIPGNSEDDILYPLAFPIEIGTTVWLKARCLTLPDAPTGEGVTQYQAKAWLAGDPEPQAWTFTQVQTSREALRVGPAVLASYYAGARFGTVTITPVENAAGQ
jgi:hypothetical protein